VATLGEDATKPQALFEHARAALAEARRSGIGTLQFYSDTLRLLPGIRLDLERELRNAIAAGEIQLRYIGRHDLGTGQLKAVQAYLRWRHPLRGEVQPAEFLPIAASTGMAVAVSRCALARFQSDLAALRGVVGEDVRLSFGPLRHHILSGTILKDLEALLRSSALQPGMIELRIAEKTVASLEKAERVVAQLAAVGASVVIDEFGRGFSSLVRIAQLPLRALQIDRRFVLAAAQRPSAMRFCEAAVALARSYGLTPVASGIDCDATRKQMLAIGCEQGLGDCFAPIELAPPAPAAAQSPFAVAS
jgi:EAL domain-containing protein (putative c-di-GMP-specific phosphodiesterase class I)